MVYKYFDGFVQEPTNFEIIDQELTDYVLETQLQIDIKMNEYKISEALNLIFDIFSRANKYIDETTPWVLGSNKKQYSRLATIMYNLLETIRIGAVLLQSFLPETADNIFGQLNTFNKNYDSIKEFKGMDVGIKLNQPIPLFIRIDKNEKLKEIEEKM